MHQNLADSTFRIQCGQSAGSGFSFRNSRYVVTNAHVIAPALVGGSCISAIMENGVQIQARLVTHSPESQFDFAILELQTDLPADRHVLQPNVIVPARGLPIIFSGFPHGVPDLLTHEAIVSGRSGIHGFYIDGSVNGGNSGGPIVDKATGALVGIITQRRFLGAIQLGQLRQGVGQLSQHCAAIAGRGGVQIMGIDFGRFAQMMAEGFSVIDQILQANANTGIGIGFRIEYVNQEYDRLGLP